MSLFGLNSGYSLKDLLENPILQNPPQLKKDGNIKQEKSKGGMSPVFDPTSAFLRPNLWDSSQFASESDVSLEYMDLDEFLSENGIPLDINENSNGSNLSVELTSLQVPSPKSADSPVRVSVTEFKAPSTPTQITTSICASPQPEIEELENKERASPELHVSVDFEIGEGEQALLNVPGEETFDPKSRKFSEDELKPQPMIKKSRKVYIAEEQKDDKYWCRRKKNNVAAKRSRDARRVKENQIAMRACFLEKCNNTLTEEVQKLRKENSQLKKSLDECEKKLKQQTV